MGLVSYVVPKGQSRSFAEEMALNISNLPQQCLLSDRQSVYDQENFSFHDAMKYVTSGVDGWC